MRNLNFSHSRVALYLRCPCAHRWRYEIGIAPRKPARPLRFGTDFHRLLEVRTDKAAAKATMAQIVEDYYNLPESLRPELGEDYLDSLKQIFLDYKKVYKGEHKPYKTEARFEICLADSKEGPVNFVGAIDEIHTGSDRIWLLDHKTFSNRPDASTLILNQQRCLYLKAYEYLGGVLPDSFVFDYIKSTPAKEPAVLKSGKLSEAKTQTITPFSWARAARRAGLPEEYAEKGIDLYKDNISNYFFRHTVDTLPYAIDPVWQGFLQTVGTIVSVGPQNDTKNLTRDCTWCEFQPLCMATMTGGKFLEQEVMEKDYKKLEQVDESKRDGEEVLKLDIRKG